MKRAQFGPHDWLSLPVPPGPSWLLVDALEPETAYQFSVLAQNKLGTSAFSEVVTVNTLGEGPRLGCLGGISWRSWVKTVMAVMVYQLTLLLTMCQAPSYVLYVIISFALRGRTCHAILWRLPGP